MALYGTAIAHILLFLPFYQSSSRSFGVVYIKYTHYSRVAIKQQQLLPNDKVSLEVDNIFAVTIFSSSIRLHKSKKNWRKYPCYCTASYSVVSQQSCFSSFYTPFSSLSQSQFISFLSTSIQK